MTAPRPKLIDRRAFLALLAGATGFGAAAWSLNRGGIPVATTMAPDGGLSGLPALTTTTVESMRRTPIAADEAAATMGGSPPARTIAALCRDAWGAQPVAGQLTTHVPVRLTVHHTASVLSSDAAAPGYVRDHQAFHQIEKGWPDIAYHFVIDAAGVVYQGRPVGAAGDTGTDYDPTGHFLVACEGDFSRHGVPDAQRAALVDLMAWAAVTHDIDPATLTGHRDWVPTACPGAAMYELVSDGSLEAAVRTRLQQGGVGIDIQCGPAATAVVAAIEAGAGRPEIDRAQPAAVVE
jgi:hypothetical protein